MRVIITGASKGIGLAITKLLLEEGHTVLGLSRSPIPIKHPNLQHLKVDLSLLSSLPEKTLQAFDPDTLILNAGKGLFAHLEELKFSDIEQVFHLNFLSPIYLTKMLLPKMKQKEKADLLFIGSIASLRGKKKGSIYCSSKAALRSFAQAMKEECSTSNVRVSLIQPGTTDTPFYENLTFFPRQEKLCALMAEDIADTLLHVLSADRRVVFEEMVITPLKHALDFKK